MSWISPNCSFWPDLKRILEKLVAKSEDVRVSLSSPSLEFPLRNLSTSLEPTCGRHDRRLRLAVFALAAILGSFLLNPDTVTATCGDYLSHGHLLSHDQQLGERESPDLFGHFQDRHPSENSLAHQSPQRKRCHGPSCQQAPLEAPLSSPVVTPDPQDRWGWMFQVDVPVPEPLKLRAAFSVPSRSLNLAFRLDRPPKF